MNETFSLDDRGRGSPAQMVDVLRTPAPERVPAN